MKRRLAVVAARSARAVRGLWPDRDPLRRRLRPDGGGVSRRAGRCVPGRVPLAALTAGEPPSAPPPGPPARSNPGTRSRRCSWPAPGIGGCHRAGQMDRPRRQQAHRAVPVPPRGEGWPARRGSDPCRWPGRSARRCSPRKRPPRRSWPRWAAAIVLGFLLSAPPAGARRAGAAAAGRLGRGLAGHRTPMDQAAFSLTQFPGTRGYAADLHAAGGPGVLPLSRR